MNKRIEYRDIKRMERRNFDRWPVCNHDKNYWCGECLNFGTFYDFKKVGFGQGHIINNLKK